VIDLAALPAPGARRPAVRATAAALRQIRRGHPWLYADSITSVSHDGAPGDLAVLFDERRDFAAIGLWDPASPIRVKVLHAGSPRPIDDGFFRDRIADAVALRRRLVDDPTQEGYRLVHGENDGLPGLVVDRYRDVVVCKIYTEAWLPHLAPVVAALDELVAPSSTVLRLARSVPARPDLGVVDGSTVGPDAAPEPVRFLENGLVFEASPTAGQKTGTFLDQRDNRGRVRDRAAGASVLDVFSSTGGFSVHAAAGGATSVVSVDLAAPALATAVRNMAHNHALATVAGCHHRVHRGDAFAVMDELAAAGHTFDLVIVDPPSFTSRQTGVPAALAAYRRLTRRAIALTRPEGTLMQASCSSRVSDAAFFAAVHEAAGAARARLLEQERTGHALDHPVGFPQGAYLKALFATVDR
jgi:23S rRNA (cytosine1962-C5)-methyltransferase